jgi:antitoxin VapB
MPPGRRAQKPHKERNAGNAPPRDRAVRAKLFANGRSQAVRLPKEFRMPGTEVLLRRQGTQIILEPLDARGLPVGFWDDIDRLTAGFAFPDPEPVGARLLDLAGDA